MLEIFRGMTNVSPNQAVLRKLPPGIIIVDLGASNPPRIIRPVLLIMQTNTESRQEIITFLVNVEDQVSYPMQSFHRENHGQTALPHMWRFPSTSVAPLRPKDGGVNDCFRGAANPRTGKVQPSVMDPDRHKPPTSANEREWSESARRERLFCDMQSVRGEDSAYPYLGEQ